MAAGVTPVAIDGGGWGWRTKKWPVEVEVGSRGRESCRRRGREKLENEERGKKKKASPILAARLNWTFRIER